MSPTSVEHEAARPAHVTVTATHVNAPGGIHVESMSDEELSKVSAGAARTGAGGGTQDLPAS
jgi:hypothetical protein